VALLAFAQVWTRPDYRWAALLGVAFGLGFLSKYAMVYFLLGVAALAVVGPRSRLAAAWRQWLVALAVAGAIMAPNLAWNATHGWATVGHTAANANWGEGGVHVMEALSFAGAQFGVFGPVLLIALLIRIGLLRRDPPSEPERLLLAMSLPILLLMIVQSGISRAHANWAAVAYVAATLLVTGWLDRTSRDWPVRAALALQVAFFAAFTLIFAGAVTVNLPKTADIFHQMRGWRSLARLASRRMAALPDGVSLAASDRDVMAELDYNLRDRYFPLVMATGKGPPGNQYELERAVDGSTGAHVLLIARWPDRSDILDRFAEHSLLEEWTVSAGPGRLRHYYIYDLSGFHG
jgi:4-amino-4-deoxy-L-arabinose transferase-like glycosyltransferase